MWHYLFETACRLEAPAAGGHVRAAGEKEVPRPDRRTLRLLLVPEVVRSRDEDHRVDALKAISTIMQQFSESFLMKFDSKQFKIFIWLT